MSYINNIMTVVTRHIGENKNKVNVIYKYYHIIIIVSK